MKYTFFVTSEKAVSLVDTLTTIFEDECQIPEGVLFETDRDDLAGIVENMEGVRHLFDKIWFDATPSAAGIGDDRIVVVPLDLEGIGEGDLLNVRIDAPTAIEEPVQIVQERRCLNCNIMFRPKQKRSRFCSKKCNDAYGSNLRSRKQHNEQQAEIAAAEDAAGTGKDEKPVCERCGRSAKVLTVGGICYSCDARTRQEAAIERVVSAAHASGGRADIVQDRVYNLSGRKLG